MRVPTTMHSLKAYAYGSKYIALVHFKVAETPRLFFYHKQY